MTIEVTTPVPGKPAAPTLTRTKFSDPSPPALDIAWQAAPAYGTTITGYQARYRMQGETGWTDYPGALDADARSLNLPGLEPGAFYEAQVRANGGGVGPWSGTGTGRANRPAGLPLRGDRHTPPWPSTRVQWGHSYGYARLPGHFEDPDGDKLTYSVGSDDPCTVRAWLQGTRLEVYMNNPVGTATRVFGTAHDAYGGVSAPAWSFYHGWGEKDREIPENSPAGTPVGEPIVGNSCNGESLIHTLSGITDGFDDNFVIDSATGQVRVKEGASLDYEGETTSWQGVINWTVSWGRTAAVFLTINVTDAEPGAIDPPTLTRTPFDEPSPPGLDVIWTAPEDNGETVTGYEVRYRNKADDGEEPSDWTAYSGAPRGSDRSITLQNLEPGQVYEARVRAVYGEQDTGPWSEIGDGRANRPPHASGVVLSDIELEVDTAIRREIVAQFADADGDTLTYGSVAQFGGIISATVNGGEVAVIALNPATSDVTYSAHDGYGGYAARTFSATGTRSETRSATENSASGTAVGAPVSGAPHDDEAITYRLTGEASGAFAIDADSGQIRVKQGARLDYETKSSYGGQVSWAVQGQIATTTLNVLIRDLSPPGRPPAPVLTPADFDPTSMLDVTWAPPARSGGASISGYQLRFRSSGGADWKRVRLTGSGRSTQLAALAQATTYEAQVRASNAEGFGGWSPSGEGVTLERNTAPRFSDSETVRYVPENSPIGTLAGAPIVATDIEAQPLSYYLNEASPLFAIDTASGQIELTANSLDFESQSSYSLVVGASDGLDPSWIDDGDAIDSVVLVRVQVTDVDEPPPKLDAPTVSRSISSPGSALDVSWIRPDMTGRPPITVFAITYKEAGSVEWANELTVPSSQTEIRLSGLRPGTRYEVLVRAENDEGISPWSDPGSGSTSGTPAPTPTPPPDPTPTPTPPTRDQTPAPTDPTPTPTPPTRDQTPAPTPPPDPAPTPTPQPQIQLIDLALPLSSVSTRLVPEITAIPAPIRTAGAPNPAPSDSALPDGEPASLPPPFRRTIWCQFGRLRRLRSRKTCRNLGDFR